MKKPQISRYKELGPLHDLLLKACPPDTEGKKSIVILAERLGVSHQYVYRWIEMNRVPAKYVSKIVKLSKGLVKYEQFHSYVFA